MRAVIKCIEHLRDFTNEYYKFIGPKQIFCRRFQLIVSSLHTVSIAIAHVTLITFVN